MNEEKTPFMREEDRQKVKAWAQERIGVTRGGIIVGVFLIFMLSIIAFYPMFRNMGYWDGAIEGAKIGKETGYNEGFVDGFRLCQASMEASPVWVGAPSYSGDSEVKKKVFTLLFKTELTPEQEKYLISQLQAIVQGSKGVQQGSHGAAGCGKEEIYREEYGGRCHIIRGENYSRSSSAS